MEDTQFVLKNRQKSLMLIPYVVVLFFLIILIRDFLQPEIYFQNTTPLENILLTFLMLLMLLGFFWFINFSYRKKVIFAHNGITLKSFLRKRLNLIGIR